MKKMLLLLPLLILNLNAANHRSSVKGAPEKVTAVEIVVPQTTPLLRFAAEELQRILGKALGKSIAITTTPNSQAVSIILGDNRWAQQAGVKLKDVPEEGYFIRRRGKRIFIVGQDSPQDRPGQNRWRQLYKRGTLSGVYDFLERFAGVRFYFPGDMGTVIPSKGYLCLPGEFDIVESPDFYSRVPYKGYNFKWYEKENYPDGVNGTNYNILRLRLSENHIPMVHGLNTLNYIPRFEKSHPEYFALRENGTRFTYGDSLVPQLCFSSGIVEEIYQDVKAYFTGKSARSRGIKRWHAAGVCGKFFSVMPQDWLYWCSCPKCAKIAPAGRRYAQAEYAQYNQAISDFMWNFTVNIAKRLKKEGIKGNITQMPYGAMLNLPNVEFPDNVYVRIAVNGHGVKRYWKSDRELIKKWAKVVKTPISLWTYPGKHMGKAELKGVPAFMPRQMGTYFQYLMPYISGAFVEAETDYAIFNYLNYYVFSKVAWNVETDVEAVIQEHYRVMFGSGAAEMAEFFDEIEQLWCDRVTGHVISTPLGPQFRLPTIYELWTKIYSPARRQKWQQNFDRAEKLCAREPEALKRIKFMRREFLGPILRAADNFLKNESIVADWHCRVPGSAWLRAVRGERNDVNTRVDIREDSKSFIFTYHCEEPFMAAITRNYRGRDQTQTFRDSCVELLLNPQGNPKSFYHIIVNVNGALYDSEVTTNLSTDLSWDSKAVAAVQTFDQGYQVTITVPKKSLGNYDPAGFPINFARHRAFNRPVKAQEYYQWSPAARLNFQAVDKFGTLKLKAVPSCNLIKNGDFQVRHDKALQAGPWLFWRSDRGNCQQKFELDPHVFISGGKSLKLTNIKGQRLNAIQIFTGMKPHQKYRIAFMIKTQGVGYPIGAGAYFSVGNENWALPRTRLIGDNPWHRLTFDITTPKNITPQSKCYLGLWIWGGAGSAWFDNVEVCPIK